MRDPQFCAWASGFHPRLKLVLIQSVRASHTVFAALFDHVHGEGAVILVAPDNERVIGMIAR